MSTSGIDFTKTFSANNTAKADASDKPKAQFWMNIGYDSGIVDEDGTSRFVSLPQGTPLDTQDHLPTNSRNNEFAAFQSARNELLDRLLARASHLTPGESCILNLQIQLRRVNDEVAPIDNGVNPFVKQFTL